MPVFVVADRISHKMADPTILLTSGMQDIGGRASDMQGAVAFT